MYVLGMDTSTMTGGVALLSGEELIGESVLNIRSTHSERLLPALQKLLSDGDLKPQDLGLICAVTGPGSFTGLRIGVATAKGLSYALRLPAVGVTTLEAYGWQFAFWPGFVIPLIDARRGRLYWQAFDQGEAVIEPGQALLADVYAWCGAQDKPCLFVGDGALNYAAEIRDNIPEAAFVSASQALLRPSAAAQLGYTRFRAGKVQDAFSLNPVYMRKTEAELKWQQRI